MFGLFRAARIQPIIHAAADVQPWVEHPMTPELATLVFDRDTRIEGDPHGALRKLWLDRPPAMSVLG